MGKCFSSIYDKYDRLDQNVVLSEYNPDTAEVNTEESMTENIVSKSKLFKIPDILKQRLSMIHLGAPRPKPIFIPDSIFVPPDNISEIDSDDFYYSDDGVNEDQSPVQ
tara:strand:+ start:933 stop:1256 length:324 start_codon:yes stop_codon:yes gene_type:complete